jgi:dihydroflavonol-4-reductase
MTAPILLTGASGYVARHVLQALLEAGHRVRASVRSPARGAALLAALPEGQRDRVEVVRLDLLADDGWAQAAAGCAAVVHTASPFPLAAPKHADDLIRPAVEGTLRALGAARTAGVGRVVLTSSIAAITASALPPGRDRHDERDWTDPAHPSAGPYVRSKMLAERAAWDFIAREGAGIALTALNPAFVLGPVIGDHVGSSVGLVRRMLAGKVPMLPRFGLAVVDVRDVARAHVAALERPQTAGRRYVLAAGSLWLAEMGRVLKAAHPDRRIPVRTAPDLLIRALALVDPAARTVVPLLGTCDRLDAGAAARELGIAFIPPEESLRATARDLIAAGLV